MRVLPAAYLLRDVFAVSRYYEILFPFVLFFGALEERLGVRLLELNRQNVRLADPD